MRFMQRDLSPHNATSPPSATSVTSGKLETSLDEIFVWIVFVLIAFFIPFCLLRNRNKIEALMGRWRKHANKPDTNLQNINLILPGDTELSNREAIDIIHHDRCPDETPLPLYSEEWNAEVSSLPVVDLQVDGVPLGISSTPEPSSPVSDDEPESPITSVTPEPMSETSRPIPSLPSYQDLLSAQSIQIPTHLLRPEDIYTSDRSSEDGSFRSLPLLLDPLLEPCEERSSDDRPTFEPVLITNNTHS
ncbi:hypothetical protein SeLEV6574_g04265 [Synchytrium endobioticum]|nr:hypothetical protein SeLEV6574_g04265 [Synchytrium endobioticum]